MTLEANILKEQKLMQEASKYHYTFMKGSGARLFGVVLPLGFAAVGAAGLVRDFRVS